MALSAENQVILNRWRSSTTETVEEQDKDALLTLAESGFQAKL